VHIPRMFVFAMSAWKLSFFRKCLHDYYNCTSCVNVAM